MVMPHKAHWVWGHTNIATIKAFVAFYTQKSSGFFPENERLTQPSLGLWGHPCSAPFPQREGPCKSPRPCHRQDSPPHERSHAGTYSLFFGFWKQHGFRLQFCISLYKGVIIIYVFKANKGWKYLLIYHAYTIGFVDQKMLAQINKDYHACLQVKEKHREANWTEHICTTRFKPIPNHKTIEMCLPCHLVPAYTVHN